MADKIRKQIIMLLASFIPLASFAAEGDSLSLGFKALNDGDSKKALEIFNQAAREKPDSVQAHFGRAQSLAQLGRTEEAKKEYKLTLLLNPGNDLSRRCKEQISVLNDKGGEHHKAEPGVSSAPLTVHPQDVEGSISRILKQSEEKINGIHNSSESYANNIYNAKADAHNKAMEQARKEVEEMRQSRYVWGRHLMPAFSEGEILQRQAELHYKAMSSLERAKSDFDNRRQEAENRALGVKESAEGLESQMINKPAETSGIFLVPNGTNLYVRNYGHFDPVMPERPEPLHAVPLKLPQLLKMKADQANKKESTNQREHDKSKQ